ncbi:MAG: glycoside hydrolase family 3 protein [Deltaproteobacteria bacterium]|nr:glycoside hydrolase family 3 protein [Deltaproteobacteria bacterium]
MTFPVGELLILGFRGCSPPSWLEEFAAAFGLGGVILFDYDAKSGEYGRNVESPRQVARLCAGLAALRTPSPGQDRPALGPLVFVDQEGGRVRRLKDKLGFAPLPSAREFAGLPRGERLALAGAAFSEMKALGIHYDLMPVADLNLNPACPDIGALDRSYGAEPEAVRENVELLSEAARRAGLGLCLKHYPGLGGAERNSHHELTDISGTVNAEQLELFHSLGEGLSGQAVLVSHGMADELEPGVPASLSPAALTPLRARLPEALLISDDLQMQGLQKFCSTLEALRRGLAAGLDMLLLGNNLLDESEQLPALAATLAQDILVDDSMAQRAEESLKRIRARKEEFLGAAQNRRED